MYLLLDAKLGSCDVNQRRDISCLTGHTKILYRLLLLSVLLTGMHLCDNITLHYLIHNYMKKLQSNSEYISGFKLKGSGLNFV